MNIVGENERQMDEIIWTYYERKYCNKIVKKTDEIRVGRNQGKSKMEKRSKDQFHLHEIKTKIKILYF